MFRLIDHNKRHNNQSITSYVPTSKHLQADEVAKHVHIHHQTYTHLTNENELHIQPPDSATNQTFSTHRRTIDQRAPQISTANRMVQFVEHYALILTISVDGKQ